MRMNILIRKPIKTIVATGLLATWTVLLAGAPPAPTAPATTPGNNNVPVGGNLTPPNTGTPTQAGNVTPPNTGAAVPANSGANLPAPGGGYGVIPNSGQAPPVGGSLNTSPANLNPNPNYFSPYGNNGYYRRGTDGSFYRRGTNGFYSTGINGQPGGFYPDGNAVYQQGPDGLYRWYNNNQGTSPNNNNIVTNNIYSRTPTNVIINFQPTGTTPTPGGVVVITNQSSH